MLVLRVVVSCGYTGDVCSDTWLVLLCRWEGASPCRCDGVSRELVKGGVVFMLLFLAPITPPAPNNMVAALDLRSRSLPFRSDVANKGNTLIFRSCGADDD